MHQLSLVTSQPRTPPGRPTSSECHCYCCPLHDAAEELGNALADELDALKEWQKVENLPFDLINGLAISREKIKAVLALAEHDIDGAEAAPSFNVQTATGKTL